MRRFGVFYRYKLKKRTVHYNERYIAVFECSDNGKFIVVCRGYFNRDKQPGCIFPTVEEAKAIYSDNAQFIGLL